MYNVISALDLRRRFDAGEPLWIADVRSASEFATGHVPTAVNIPMEQIESRLADLPQDRQVVLICESGKRACLTADWLKQRANISVVEGGTRAWREAGLPVVCCGATRWSLERQVRLGAGFLVLAGTLLSLFVAQPFVYIAMFVGAGLTFAGLTNFCPMGIMLARM